MIGDQSDMLARLKSVLPGAWFPDTQYGQPTNSPVLDGLLSGSAACMSWAYSLLSYVKTQTRIATASGVWLDIIAGDFFNGFITRRVNELDTSFRTRITRELFRPKGTRAAVVKALTDLTGRAPIVFEPMNTGDTGGYALGGAGYGCGGGYGSLHMPFQFLVTALRPSGGGVATVAGYASDTVTAGVATAVAPGGYPGAYGSGAIEYASLAVVASPVSDTDILNTINSVRPVATIAWTQIENSNQTPTPPGAASGVTAAPAIGTTGSVALSWSAVSGATSYTILQRLTGTTPWSAAANWLAGTSDTISGLTGGTKYDFAILALNSAGPSTISAVASAAAYSVALSWGSPSAHSTVPSTGVHSTGMNGAGGINVTATPDPTSPVAVYYAFSTSNTAVPTTGLTALSDATGSGYGWYGWPTFPATPNTYYFWVVVQTTATSGVITGALVSSAITIT